MVGLVILFVHLYTYLRVRQDRRVQNVQLLLLTATRKGYVVDVIESILRSAKMQVEEVCVAREPGRPEYEVVDLFDVGVAEKPEGWTRANMPMRACLAAEAMTRYLWNRRKSAQILFILPGEKEVYEVRNALSIWDFRFDWEPYVCLGETSREELGAILERLRRQQFQRSWPSVFFLTTAGVSEDGWTVHVNGVVDSGLQVNVDDLGFLHVGPEDEVSATQRRGRAGRVADGLFCRLMEASATRSTKRMPYPEQQQVCLASASLRVPWPPPGGKGAHATLR